MSGKLIRIKKVHSQLTLLISPSHGKEHFWDALHRQKVAGSHRVEAGQRRGSHMSDSGLRPAWTSVSPFHSLCHVAKAPALNVNNSELLARVTSWALALRSENHQQCQTTPVTHQPASPLSPPLSLQKPPTHRDFCPVTSFHSFS